MPSTALTTDPNLENPYRSPLVANELRHWEGSENDASRYGFRWRIVPVTVLYLYGGSLIFVALLATIHMAVWTAVFLHRGQHVLFAWVTSVMRGSIVAAVLGTLLIVGARDIWRRRWLRGALEVSAAIMGYAIFAAIGGRLIEI